MKLLEGKLFFPSRSFCDPKGSRARIVDAFAEEFKLTINERVQRRGDSAEH